MTTEEKLKLLQAAGIVVNGDLVLEKHVENEIGNVEAGGIGIMIQKGDKSADASNNQNQNEEIPALSNNVFVERLHGKILDLNRLYEWISDHFVERIQQDNSKQYIWAALYLFCVDNKLLCHNCARKDFVGQMSDWFSWCNVECTEAQIRRYKCLEGRMEKHIGPNEFDQIPDKQNASHLGYLEIERIYNDLKKHYNEDLLLKGIAIK